MISSLSPWTDHQQHLVSGFSGKPLIVLPALLITERECTKSICLGVARSFPLALLRELLSEFNSVVMGCLDREKDSPSCLGPSLWHSLKRHKQCACSNYILMTVCDYFSKWVQLNWGWAGIAFSCKLYWYSTKTGTSDVYFLLTCSQLFKLFCAVSITIQDLTDTFYWWHGIWPCCGVVGVISCRWAATV